MKFATSITVMIVTALCFVSASYAYENAHPMATIDAYERLVDRLVDMKKAEFTEKERWKEQKEYLEQEHRLLLKEKKILNERIAEAKKTKSEHELEIAQTKKHIADAEKAISQSLPNIERAELDLVKVAKILPDFLKKDFPFYNKKVNKEEKASKRLQNVFLGYAFLEQYNNSIKATQEMLETEDGRKMIFDVVYLGMSQAYAVSRNDDFGAVGFFAKDGKVKWQWCNEHAGQIRTAINLVAGDDAAVLVNLPMPKRGDIR